MLGRIRLKRGDIVRVAVGKPRPALIVQSDLVATPAELLVCPITTTIHADLFYRIPIQANAASGLHTVSQVMADKVAPARRDKIDGVIGRVTDKTLEQVTQAIAALLALGD